MVFCDCPVCRARYEEWKRKKEEADRLDAIYRRMEMSALLAEVSGIKRKQSE